MLKPAWMSHCKSWMRHPAARIGLVIVLGTCLWAMFGRRDRVATTVVAARTLDAEMAPVETSRPPVALGVRRLPQRMLSRPANLESAPIQADFVTVSPRGEGNIHAAGFSVEVTANSPAWLTGTIEYDEPGEN